MRRKIIKQGKGTLTMSLPAAWIKQLSLKAGDEVDVEEQGLRLIVGPALGKRGRKTEVDLTGLNRRLIFVVLSNLYVRGDDEIRLRFEKPEHYDVIADGVRWLLGFEIVEHTKKSCLLKELARGESEDFDTILRRIMLLLLSIAEDGYEALKNKDLEALAAIRKRDESVNTLVLYCLRVLNKRGGKNIQHAMHLYALLTLLEHLGDEYSRLYRIKKIKPNTLKLTKRVTGLLRHFYELFYKFEKSKARNLMNERDALRSAIDIAFAKVQSKDDFIALHHLRSISDLIIDIEKFNMAMQI